MQLFFEFIIIFAHFRILEIFRNIVPRATRPVYVILKWSVIFMCVLDDSFINEIKTESNGVWTGHAVRVFDAGCIVLTASVMHSYGT